MTHEHDFLPIAKISGVQVLDCACGERKRVYVPEIGSPQIVIPEHVGEGSVNNVLYDLSSPVGAIPAILR